MQHRCHCFLPGPWLPSQLQIVTAIGSYQFICSLSAAYVKNLPMCCCMMAKQLGIKAETSRLLSAWRIVLSLHIIVFMFCLEIFMACIIHSAHFICSSAVFSSIVWLCIGGAYNQGGLPRWSIRDNWDVMWSAACKIRSHWKNEVTYITSYI